MNAIRILLADDSELFRRTLQSFFESQPSLRVCGEAADGVEAVQKAKELRPDIVLMDIKMPRMDGLQATRIIRRELPDTKVVIVSQNDPALMRNQVLEVEAHGFLRKSNLSRELIPSIEQCLKQSSKKLEADRTGWLSDRSEMGTLIRSTDWASTPLKSPEQWSPALRMVVKFLLANRFPQLLWWGREFCCLYNDAYIPVLGTKHPWALGKPVKEVWSEIWHILKPLIETPYQGGPSTWMEDIPLEINRSGFVEETHFTVAYSPVPDETVSGGIGGVLATVHEITEKVIGERRIIVLRDLGSRNAAPKSAEDACVIAAESLERHRQDIPFALLYLMDSTRDVARLVCGAGIELNDRGCPKLVDLSSSTNHGIWDFSKVIATDEIQLVTDLSGKFDSIPRGTWSDPPCSAALVPVRSNISNELAGLMVLGISSRIKFDEKYRDFLTLLSTQVATSIGNARAYEEERRRAEALAEIDRAKTTFFSNVSHEFRTPLTLMLAPLQDLLARSQTHLSPTAKDQLELVNRNGARLLRLVNTLLDFSRIEAGRIQAVYEATDLPRFTAELASVFRSATEKAGLRLVTECRELGEPVYVDRDMWEKVVLNLVSNAFKFTFEGEIVVAVQRNGNNAELRVHDTGVGITPEALPRIFERFHRVPNARSRTHEGSGIGLALVHELVKLHGGFITVDSKVGDGTTFVVSIPFGQSHLPAGQLGGSRNLSSTATGAKPFVEEALRWLPDECSGAETFSEPDESLPVQCPRPLGSASRPRILFADDNFDMRQYVARLLSEHYEVETVADGKTAFDTALQHPPHLILSDVMMPTLDGFELLNAIRNDDRTRRIPVILLSARAGEESRVEGMHAGANDYLIKPFSARELLARIGARLEIVRIQQEREKAAAADLDAMTRLHELGTQYVRAGNNIQRCLDATVETAIFLTGAEKGNLQTLDSGSHTLRLVAQHGFEERFLNFFATVNDTDSACGSAMSLLRQVVVEDVTESDVFVGKPALDVLLEAGVRAVQSMPLVSSSGQLLGIVSTYFSHPHRPSERDMRLVQLLARHAADYLERKRRENAIQRAEEELREAHEKLKIRDKERTVVLQHKTEELIEKAALLDMANDAIFVKNSTGKISYWNRGAERLYGWKATEALGHSPAELLQSEYPIPLSEIDSRDDWEGEIRHSKRDGSRIVVASRWTKIRDSNGNLGGWLEINTDITPRKRAEDSARALSGRILTVQDEERRRIAKGLHDSLGQYLVALKMNLEGFPSLTPPQVAAVTESSEIVDKCLTETRTISYLLHPPLLDESGFGVAAQWYVEGFARRSGIKVNLDLPKELIRLHPDAEIALFRAVQESLTNIHKHANSSLVDIRVTQDAKQVRLEIADNGKGIPTERLRRLLEGAAELGVGIAGMRERFRELGGSLEIRSNRKGTTIIVTAQVPQGAMVNSTGGSDSTHSVSAA